MSLRFTSRRGSRGAYRRHAAYERSIARQRRVCDVCRIFLGEGGVTGDDFGNEI
jgi:hypothetical protein